MSETQTWAGFELAGYRVHEVIGRGGMGVVYRATDVQLDRPVALKVLIEDGTLDGGSRERLLDESRRAARLDHPNVVPVYEAGDANGRLFFAMRFVPGTDLKALLRREGALAPARAIAIAAQVADALDAAHRRGLVHRDVKPSNVLLDQEDEREHAYLADFGLTRPVADGSDGHFSGSPDYVSPEQIRGEAVDGRADQYGLACLLFECLTGTLPYRQASQVAAIFAHLQEPPPAASERAVELPAAIDPVLARGMAKEREERFGSCAELAGAARDALGLDAPPRAAPRPLVFALAAVLGLAIAAAIAFALTRESSPPPPAPPGTLVRVDPRTNAVVKRTPVDGHPGELAVTRGGIWMADFRGGVLWRYEPGSGTPERITSNGEPRDVAELGGKVYVAADGKFLSGVVSRYDAVTGVREQGVDLLACAIASGEGVVWAAGCPFVQRLSTGPGKMRILHQTYIPYATPTTVENVRGQIRELAVGAGALWVLGDAADRRLWRLDPRTGRTLATIALPFPPRSAVVAGGALWITDALDDRVYPIDVGTNTVGAPVHVGRGPAGVTFGAGSVWTANALDGTLSRIDPRTRRVTTVDVGGSPHGLAVGDGAVWVTEDEG